MGAKPIPGIKVFGFQIVPSPFGRDMDAGPFVAFLLIVGAVVVGIIVLDTMKASAGA